MAGTGSVGRAAYHAGRGQSSAEEAQTLVVNARRAFFVMVGVLAVIWAIQIANAADSYHFTSATESTRTTSAACPTS